MNAPSFVYRIAEPPANAIHLEFPKVLLSSQRRAPHLISIGEWREPTAMPMPVVMMYVKLK